MKQKPKTRISRITVSRLYNCGNYENCSYSVTIDVAEGESAARGIRALEKILIGLAPLRDVFGPADATRKRAELDRMKGLTEEAFQRQYGKPKGGRNAYYRRCLADLKEEISKSKKKFARAKKARDLFDDLGGAEKWKDAKDNWEESFDEY